MVGTTLADRYVLSEELATGGMGTVYVATDSRLERRVAVKLMKVGLADDPRFVERFRREARAAGALSHPNVAGVFDYGDDQHRPFIVMELVEGRDLARLLREEGPLEEARVLSIAAQIADALGHAHAAGVVHRDVKPANVIVGTGDRVKVTDFGIARAQTDSALTATGSLLGTAQYISPEQASGAEVAPSSDIYSLGIVCFEMLTGSVPYTGDSAVAVAMRHVSDRVPAPSTLQPRVSPAMDDCVMTATAREPRDRFADTAAFAAALTAVTSGTTDPGGAQTSILAPAATSTAVLSGTSTRTTAEDWPFPGHPSRWDPRTLGRVVLGVFAVLLLIAVALVAYRIADQSSDADRNPAGADAARQQDTVSETPEAPAEQAPVEVPPLAGLTYDEAAAELAELGLTSERVDEPSDEEAGVVFETSPAAGTEVSPDETVTLHVSTGPAEEESDEEDEDSSGEGEDFVPPGQAKKDNGKGKDD